VPVEQSANVAPDTPARARIAAPSAIKARGTFSDPFTNTRSCGASQ
jgi:hypothetical protein